MMKKLKLIDRLSNNLVKAFLENKIISPVPLKYSKNIKFADKLRRMCESKIKKPIIGFKAGGTALPVLKKLKEKEPFYASVFKHNFIKSGKSVKINKYNLGIELEVCYLIKNKSLSFKKSFTIKNVKKFITHTAPCIEVVGYRQRKKGIKFLGDLCGDFGGNIKFLIGKKKKYKNINIGHLKTKIFNKKTMQLVNGNTNTVYINPLNALRFVLNKIKRDKIQISNDFYVFTGSTVGVVPIIGKGVYVGNIEKIGSVKAKII